MPKIKVTEIFHSLQGEGLWVGVPSTFLRTFGCNFKCTGFGMDGGKSVEADFVADDFQMNHPEWKLEDLPVVKTGCDSYFSWHPKFKKLSPMMTVDEIIEQLSRDRMKSGTVEKIKHLVITGGEPLLGWQKSYPELLAKAAQIGYTHITFETNGTQEINEELANFITLKAYDGPVLDITFSVSPKLPCSNEKMEEALRPEIIASYKKYGTVYLKFVVSNKPDVEHTKIFVEDYTYAGFDGEIYLMPCGSDTAMYDLNAPAVAELAIQNGWRYSPRLQVELWKNLQGT